MRKLTRTIFFSCLKRANLSLKINTPSIVLSFLLLNSTSLKATEVNLSRVPDYANMFNREIYQQNLGQTAQELEVEKMGQLSLRRKDELDRLCLEQLYKNKSQQLEEVISDARQVINIYSRQVNNGFNNLGKIVTLTLASKKLVEDIYYSKLVSVSTLSAGFAGLLETPETASVRTRIALFENKIEILRRKIDEGHISAYEKKYVKIKRLLDPNLQAQIEEELMQGYNAKDSFFTLINKKFIDLAIALPYMPMQIYKGNFQEEDLKLCQNFNSHPLFKNYPEKLRKELLDVVRKITFASCESENSQITRRGVYVLQGDPACGKSLFCSELARFLGIPVFETSIRSPDDLAMGKAEGSCRYTPQTNPGWLVKALLGNLPFGQGFNNGLLVLNDFDRVMNDQRALSFLLDYLDPSKKKIYLPFLDIEHDFSRLSIILTMNSSIPRDKIHQALNSRIPVINFPNFKKEDQIRIINESGYLTDLLKFYAFPNWIKVKYTDNEILTFISTIEDEDYAVYFENLTTEMAGVDLRLRKTKLDKKFNSISLKIRDTADKIYGIAMRLQKNLQETNTTITRYNHMCEAIQGLEGIDYDPRVHSGMELKDIYIDNIAIKNLKDRAAQTISIGNFTPQTDQTLNIIQNEIIEKLSRYQMRTPNPVIMLLLEAANLGLVKAANEIGKITVSGGYLTTFWFKLVLDNNGAKGFKEPILEAIQNLKDLYSHINNHQEILNCIVMAANLGDAKSLFELGNKFYAENEYRLAKSYYKEAANNGCNEAQQKMGKLTPLIQDNTTLVTLLNNNFDGLAPLLTSLSLSGTDNLTSHFSNFIRLLSQMKTLEKLSVLKTNLSNEKIVELAVALKKVDNIKEVSLSMPYTLSHATEFMTGASRELWADYTSPTCKISTPQLVASYMLLPISMSLMSLKDIVSIVDSNGAIMSPADHYGENFYWVFTRLKEIPTLEKLNMHIIGYINRKEILREYFNSERQKMNLPVVKVEFI